MASHAATIAGESKSPEQWKCGRYDHHFQVLKAKYDIYFISLFALSGHSTAHSVGKKEHRQIGLPGADKSQVQATCGLALIGKALSVSVIGQSVTAAGPESTTTAAEVTQQSNTDRVQKHKWSSCKAAAAVVALFN